MPRDAVAAPPLPLLTLVRCARTRSIQFTLELTPLKVKKTERRGGTFVGFLTRCAAVIGGLFTVAGIVDSAIYHTSKQLVKMQVGKAS